MLAKMASLTDRYEEVSGLLADPEVMGERDRFTALSREFAELEPVVQRYQALE